MAGNYVEGCPFVISTNQVEDHDLFQIKSSAHITFSSSMGFIS